MSQAGQAGRLGLERQEYQPDHWNQLSLEFHLFLQDQVHLEFLQGQVDL